MIEREAVVIDRRLDVEPIDVRHDNDWEVEAIEKRHRIIEDRRTLPVVDSGSLLRARTIWDRRDWPVLSDYHERWSKPL